MKITIQVANHTVAFDSRFPEEKRRCREYRSKERPEACFRLSEEERLKYTRGLPDADDPHWEGLFLYLKISEYLLSKDILLFHGAAVALDGECYIFTAPSGTGKTTPALLWQQRFGSRFAFVNGDKPLISFEEKGIFVHGTPWCGKEQLQTRMSAPLKGIVVIKQASRNGIRRLTEAEALDKLVPQAYVPEEMSLRLKAYELVFRLCRVPVYELSCTISQEAVTLSHDALTMGLVPGEDRV